MPKQIPFAFPVEVTRKWLALAQRRKAHLVDLYESGRWRLYYTEAEFIDRLREAIHGVDRWNATEQASVCAVIHAAVHDREFSADQRSART